MLNIERSSGKVNKDFFIQIFVELFTEHLLQKVEITLLSPSEDVGDIRNVAKLLVHPIIEAKRKSMVKMYFSYKQIKVKRFQLFIF